MYNYKSIASALRKAGLSQCRETHLSHLGFLIKHNVDSKGMVKARPYKQSGKSYLFHGYGMETVLRFLEVNYNTGNDAPRGGKLGDYIEYCVYDLYNALKRTCQIDIPGALLKAEAGREVARQLETERKQQHAALAALIEPDKIFYDDLQVAAALPGREKSLAYAHAFTNLLNRLGQSINSTARFWTVFKLVRFRCEEKFNNLKNN